MNTSITKLIGEIVRTNPDPSRLIHLIVRISRKYFIQIRISNEGNR